MKYITEEIRTVIEPLQINANIEDVQMQHGSGNWDKITNKPFETVDDETLKVQDKKLKVNLAVIASKAEVENKLDNAVVTDSTVDADETSSTLIEVKKNLKSGAITSTEIPLPIANDEQVGFMTPEQVAALAGALVAIGLLQGQTARLLYTAKTDPTASEILAFVQSQGYPPEKYSAIAVVIKDTNHIWKYETNNNAFRDYGLDTITQATQELLGIVKGATANGKIFVEADGSMSLNGYDAITTALANLATALGGKVSDVKINGTTAVSENIAEIPIGSDTVLGVIRANSTRGTYISASGQLQTVMASNADIDAKSSIYKPIVPSNLEYAIRKGLGSNSVTWTEAEKQAARDTLGITEAINNAIATRLGE